MLFTEVGFTLIRLCRHGLWWTSDADVQLQRWESAAVTVKQELALITWEA